MTTAAIANIIPNPGTVMVLKDAPEFWQNLYTLDQKVLLVATESEFSQILCKLYNTIFPGITHEQTIGLLELVDQQTNNLIGLCDRAHAVDKIEYLSKFKTNKALVTQQLPIELTVDDLGMEMLILVYVCNRSVDGIILPRLNDMLRKKVCGVIYDFKMLFMNNLPSVAKQHGVDILDDQLMDKLVGINHNFSYIFDPEWTPNTLQGMENMLKLDKLAVLDFYQFILQSFIRYRVPEWPMISGVQDFYDEPRVFLDTMIRGTDYRTRGWPGDEWFYQINKMMWNRALTDHGWAAEYSRLLKI